MSESIKELLASRKFLIAIGDALASTLAIVLAWFLAPDKVSQVIGLVALWQPIMISVIIAIAAQNVAGIRADSDQVQAQLSLEETKAKVESASPVTVINQPAAVQTEGGTTVTTVTTTPDPASDTTTPK